MKSLACMEYKFLTELPGKPTRDGAPLHLLFTEKDWWEMQCLDLILHAAAAK